MMEFGKIDDPVDASFEAWPEEPGGLGIKANELALSFGGLMFPPAKVWKIMKDQFAGQNRFARIEYLFNGIRIGLKVLESENSSDRDVLLLKQSDAALPHVLKVDRTNDVLSVEHQNPELLERFFQAVFGPIEWK
jgi:hypothetical protein